MTKKSNIYITLGIIIIVAISGYFFGSTVLTKKNSESEQKITPVSETAEQEIEPTNETPEKPSNVIAYRIGNEEPEPEKPIDTISSDRIDLKASTPSIGPLIKSVPVHFDVEKRRLSVGQKQALIKKGQRVLFYNKDGSLHLQDANISFIAEDENKQDIIAALDLNGPLDIDLLSDKAKVITMQTSAVARLPHSALVKDTDGQFIIKATPLDLDKQPTTRELAEQYLLERVPTQTFLKDDNYFELDFRMNTTDLIILNPSSTIKDNTIVSFISIDSIDAPETDPLFSARAKAYIEESAKISAELAIAAAECKANAAAVVQLTPENDLELSNPGRDCSSENASSACGGNTNMSSAPGSCGGGGGCGSGSCAGGSGCGASPGGTMIDPYILLGIERLTPEMPNSQ